MQGQQGRQKLSWSEHDLLLLCTLSIRWWDLSQYSFHHLCPIIPHCQQSHTHNHAQELFSSNWLLKCIHVSQRSLLPSSFANLKTIIGFVPNLEISEFTALLSVLRFSIWWFMGLRALQVFLVYMFRICASFLLVSDERSRSFICANIHSGKMFSALTVRLTGLFAQIHFTAVF